MGRGQGWGLPGIVVTLQSGTKDRCIAPKPSQHFLLVLMGKSEAQPTVLHTHVLGACGFILAAAAGAAAALFL